MCDARASSSEETEHKPLPPETERLYRVLKEYAVHEDHLMNVRMNWCLLINSFLITGVAVVAADSQQLPALSFLPGAPNSLYGALLIASFLGLLMTAQSIRGVSAASASMHRLRDHWTKVRGALPGHQDLPQILGGYPFAGNNTEQEDANVGKEYPAFMLWGLLFVWLALGAAGAAGLFGAAK